MQSTILRIIFCIFSILISQSSANIEPKTDENILEDARLDPVSKSPAPNLIGFFLTNGVTYFYIMKSTRFIIVIVSLIK